MTTKVSKFAYDIEQRRRGLFARLIREVDKGNRTPILTYLRSVALSREQQRILADWLSHVELGGDKPKRLTIEDYIIALARVAQKGEQAKLPPGKRLKKGRRQEIWSKLSRRLLLMVNCTVILLMMVSCVALLLPVTTMPTACE